jgi:hypothetical protein
MNAVEHQHNVARLIEAQMHTDRFVARQLAEDEALRAYRALSEEPVDTGCASRTPELDADQLLSSGAVAGPFRRAHPFTVTWRTRALRWIRRQVLNLRSPL